MLPVPVLAAVTTLSLSDRTSAELYHAPERGSTAVDVGTAPSVSLSVTSRSSAFSLSYGPRLGWIDVTRDGEFVLQHTAGAGYSWGTRRLRLSLTVGGTYGRVSYLSAVAAAAPVTMQPPTGAPGDVPGATPGPTPTPTPGGGQEPSMSPAAPGQLLPQISVLEVASAGVGFNASYALSRRWGLLFGIGFGVGGGLNDSARFLPFRYGPFAGVGAAYQLTLKDSLTTGLSASLDIVPDTRGRFYTVTLMESWTHQFDPLAASTLGAGLTYAQSREGPRAERDRSVNGAGLASFWKGYKLPGGAMLGLTASATLSTGYNPVLGELSQTLGGSLGAGWSRKKLSLSVGVDASQSLPVDDPEAFRSYGANAGIGYQLNELISLDAGAYWTRQVLPDDAVVIGLDQDRWGFNLGVSISAPPIKL